MAKKANKLMVAMLTITYPDTAPAVFLHRTFKGAMKHAAELALEFASSIHPADSTPMTRLHALEAAGNFDGVLDYWAELSATENGELIDVELVYVED